MKKLFNLLTLAVLIIACGWTYFLYQQSENKPDVTVQTSITSIEKVKELTFLNVGLEKVISAENSTTVFGYDIPFSKKTTLVVLKYKAKFGIKEAVRIEENETNDYTVIVPKFQVIGFELDKDSPYELYSSNGELLSSSTKEIDTGELIAQELSTKEQEQYLKDYTNQIKESANNYYETLFKSINPNYKVTVTFTN
jgi:hypothetical protein